MPAIPDAEFFAVQQALAGQYSLERELGRGGMGVVYLAREVELERLVAIKVLPPALGARPGLRERFVREARTAARLSHPNIVPIHRVGEAGEFVYFAMAYVEGESLGDRLRARGTIGPDEVSRVLRDVAWALAYAHAQGVVHRDVKPDNILIERDSGRVLVSDFGIAQLGGDVVSMTDPETVMGTTHYMSPEQAASETIDGRSDLYGLGVVGYLALSGRLPIDGATAAVVLARQLTVAPEPLAALAPAAPPSLVAAIERCLAKSPDARYTSGEALAEALAPGLVRRAELPLPLRAWARAEDPARGFYVAWSAIFAVPTVMEFITQQRVQPVVVALGLLPIIPVLVFELRHAIRVLQSGYALADLRLALAQRTAQRREELAHDLDERPTLAARLLRGFGWAGLATFGSFVATAATLGGGFVRETFEPLFSPMMLQWVVGLTTIGAVGALATANALGAPIFGRQLKLGMVGRLRGAVWNSRIGEFIARKFGRAGGGESPALVSRPTEMALGMAAADLFASLPRPLREQLGEVPEVVRRLEARAAEARRSVDELQGLLGDAEGQLAASAAARAGAADTALLGRRTATARELTRARDVAREDLSRTVAALERIRLDLLRLAAGDERRIDVTTLLDAARDAADGIALVADARQQAERIAESVADATPPDPRRLRAVTPRPAPHASTPA